MGGGDGVLMNPTIPRVLFFFADPENDAQISRAEREAALNRGDYIKGQQILNFSTLTFDSSFCNIWWKTDYTPVKSRLLGSCLYFNVPLMFLFRSARGRAFVLQLLF